MANEAQQTVARVRSRPCEFRISLDIDVTRPCRGSGYPFRLTPLSGGKTRLRYLCGTHQATLRRRGWRIQPA
jgi:hypothetical protein